MNLFDIEKVKKDLEKLESKTLEADFWNDSKTSAPILQQIKMLKDKKEDYMEVYNSLETLLEMNEL